MNNKNMYYNNYNYLNKYNNFYRSIYNNPYTAFYHPYTENLPNYNINNFDNKIYSNNDLKSTKTKLENNTSSNMKQKENTLDTTDFEPHKSRSSNISFGPLNITNEKISIFGFSIQIDDLILIALILFLYFETDCDYSILIVLGLMLFNISFSSLDFI